MKHQSNTNYWKRNVANHSLLTRRRHCHKESIQASKLGGPVRLAWLITWYLWGFDWEVILGSSISLWPGWMSGDWPRLIANYVGRCDWGLADCVGLVGEQRTEARLIISIPLIGCSCCWAKEVSWTTGNVRLHLVSRVRYKSVKGDGNLQVLHFCGSRGWAHPSDWVSLGTCDLRS